MGLALSRHGVIRTRRKRRDPDQLALPPPEMPSDDGKKTFSLQHKLPRLPRYLRALRALQDDAEHDKTRAAVDEFLQEEGPRIQEKLVEYAKDKDSYIEEFWYESYLAHSDPVVLRLNPFFVLEDDPTPSRGSQLPRAASLITASLGFIHDLRNELLMPDTVRGIPLDMDQYRRLFGTARIPTPMGCRMTVSQDSTHIIVLRRGQFYWFDVLDEQSRLLMTEREILQNLKAIVADADKLPVDQIAATAVGMLSTENRKVWSKLRKDLQSDRANSACLNVIDQALFAICLDDAAPEKLSDVCNNFLCGSYNLTPTGVQIGTCTNRWYDKLQIIVCANGVAGINFEHTGVDGHTVLRFAADIFTEGLMLLARSINPSAPTMFSAPLSPLARSYKPPRGTTGSPGRKTEPADTTPKKLEWSLNPELRIGIRYAETRISDLICQNDCQALEFKGFGKNFITRYGFSPDAFVQMAFQAAYFGLYGRIECTYEPAMTKSFIHGRTEAIRTVQDHTVNFTQTFFSDASLQTKIETLRKACEGHVNLTKECSKGLGQDRHLYALYCLLQRELQEQGTPPPSPPPGEKVKTRKTLPAIFTDNGWSVLNTSILSTSNCGNPALRLFGFGPVAEEGFGIGYIIKDDGISVCASSKHLQTRRYLDTLQGYLFEVQRMIVQLHRQANERSAPFVDHAGILRDVRTGVPISNGYTDDPEEWLRSASGEGGAGESEELTGYSFFDSGEVDPLRRSRVRDRLTVGKPLAIAEY
ncbi:acyltransferase ChoActase/COT/CPT [Auriculariales sp. MPI-PUGE-AT-0066]|nr:acyltransferase ChoActase/COT/CPT [Auriculariales sp. MPI-PUGE-AT-0066]